MTTQMTYRLMAMDETGQKQTWITASGDTLWAEVGAMGVAGLDLPTDVGGEPVIYHLFDDSSGEALLPGQTVGDVLREAGVEFRLRVAQEMKPA